MLLEALFCQMIQVRPGLHEERRRAQILSAESTSASQFLSSVVELWQRCRGSQNRNVLKTVNYTATTHILFLEQLFSPCEGSVSRSFERFYNTDGWKSCWLTAGRLTAKLKNWTICSISERDLGLCDILSLGPKLPIRWRR